MPSTTALLQRRLRLGQLLLFVAAIASVALVAGALTAKRPALAIVAAVVVLGGFPLRAWLTRLRSSLSRSEPPRGLR